jgi:antitoxin component YwqK of YwqJK toxin-antitoxin module
MKKHIYLIAFLFILTSCNKLSSIETLSYDEVILNDEFEYFDFKPNENISRTSDTNISYFVYDRGTNQEFGSFKIIDNISRNYLKYKGMPFTGILKVYFFEPQTHKKLSLMETSIYKDGKLNGHYILYNTIGETLVEANFKKGYLDGNYKEFEERERSADRSVHIKKVQDANFKAGLLDGKYEKYNNNGKLEEIKNYRNGQLVSYEKLPNLSPITNFPNYFDKYFFLGEYYEKQYPILYYNYDSLSFKEIEDSKKDYEGIIVSDRSYRYINNYEIEIFCEKEEKMMIVQLNDLLDEKTQNKDYDELDAATELHSYLQRGRKIKFSAWKFPYCDELPYDLQKFSDKFYFDSIEKIE